MKKGERVHNFEILETVDLSELDAKGIWARHESGAGLFHVYNGSDENLFAFAFATPPEDSSGAAHILEHSVLCGSERYPLKDAFIVLAQGSLQTFLNAWTFPDKTMYPASSVNEKDYFNLMSVYGDAVFRPLLTEWTFMQEGWRLEPAEKGLAYSGVVYNEMKGAYSSMDAYAGLWSVKAVMPGTPYAFDSGGDPDCIPRLSREALKEFHRSRYSPGNCRIFLAGNIPTEKQMEFLDKVCLAGLPAGKPLPRPARTLPWNESRFVRVSCPGSGEETKPQAFVSWLCSDTVDTAETTALACLAEILLGHDGSPLTRTLIESGLGEDLSPSSGFEGELGETLFCAGLRGVNAERQNGTWDVSSYEKIEKLILGELERLAREGIPKKEIDAAMFSIEFSHREIRRSHGPYSLVWLRRAMRGWLNGAKPWETLLFVPNFDALKQRLAENSRYFEGLIETYLVNNPHRALVAVEPEDDYLSKKEAELCAALAEKEKSMSAAEKKALEKKVKALEKIQGEGESPEALAAIPHLSRSDLVPQPDIIPGELRFIAGSGGDLPCLVHPLFTNGISYAELAFPVDVLEAEDYPWLPFFARAVVSVGLPGMDYGEVSSLLARTAGGFYAMLETGSPAPREKPAGAAAAEPTAEEVLPSSMEGLLGRDWIVYRLKALDEKFKDSLDLALRLITDADFSDLRRLKDLVAEMKNDCDSSLAPAGHSYAAGRSGGACSRSRAVDEVWNGLSQLPFSHDLAAADPAEISRRLFSIRDALASRAGLIVNLTAQAEALSGALKAAAPLGRFGAPRPANPRCREIAPFLALAGGLAGGGMDGNGLAGGGPAEVWSSPSIQIGFAAMTLPAAPYGSREQAAELVFSHELSTGALWESIRMKGGAYGAFARPDSLEGVFSLTTYRDPNPLRSLKTFPEILLRRSGLDIGEDSLEKSIIGTFAHETVPRTPSSSGFTGFLRCLYGVTSEHRFTRLKAIVALTAEDIAAAASRLAGAAAAVTSPATEVAGGFPGRPVIIAGTGTAEKAAAALGVEARKLPV
ncbi:MAG: insulinase family protein [Treponema sp.]|jgi:Zn-dependent M16 (insulinase) family peptidase|nr:insulinase family protein [Treponema sp.]